MCDSLMIADYKKVTRENVNAQKELGEVLDRCFRELTILIGNGSTVSAEKEETAVPDFIKS